MNLRRFLTVVVLAAVFLAGCGVSEIMAPTAPVVQPVQPAEGSLAQPDVKNPVSSLAEPATPAAQPSDTAQEQNPPAAAEPTSVTLQQVQAWPDGETQFDEQGQVVVGVAPINLNNPGGTLDFDVGMNTHSVNLSMDLASLATLSTDTGLTVNGAVWDAPRSGHHVSGILSFPTAVGGTPLLDGASSLTLIIRDVDAPERIFVWETLN